MNGQNFIMAYDILIDVSMAARICQRRENVIREVLNNMERGLGYLTWSGADVKDRWRLRPELFRKVDAHGDVEPNRFLDREGAKDRIIKILEHRSEREKNGLSNAEIREITMASRDQVKRFMAELKDEGRVMTKGKGGGAVWVYKHKSNNAE
ncbi:MAG: hypothetical protein GY859_08110 [Desulfobacterales bacterium]|nr:hypothetical protein [Desulfobacterales bacterium]